MRPLEKLTNLKSLLILLIVSFGLVTILVKQFDFFGIDLKITQIVQSFNFPFFKILMIWVSRLGEVWWGFASVIFFSLILFFGSKKKSLAFMIVLTSSTMVALNQAIKFLVARPRPGPTLVAVEGVFKNADSFPSGHVMFFIALYGFLLFFVYTNFKKSNWLRAVLVIIFSLLIFFVGLSRIYLGAHWFSDVLGAYLLGLFWLLAMIWLYKKYERAI